MGDDAQACTQIVKLLLLRPDLDVNSTRIPTYPTFWSGAICAAWEWIGRTLDWELFRMLLSREDFDPSAYFSGAQVEGKSTALWNYMQRCSAASGSVLCMWAFPGSVAHQGGGVQASSFRVNPWKLPRRCKGGTLREHFSVCGWCTSHPVVGQHQ